VGGTGSQGSFVVENHGTIGTFSYEIILTATDSSGLKTNTSVVLPVIASETTPPSAPTNLTATAASSTQVNLSWSASTDNVGVTGYLLERCQGAGCTSFAQVATPSGTSFNDSGLTANTSYSYRVRATDASGNLSAYSGVATATTLSGSPAVGLMAAYGFNEGTGATVADASGNGNSGTINGASWSTQGKFGGALSFNGVNNLVQIAGSASVNVSAAMTLEAWIFPTAAQSGWRTIVQREVDAYSLNASSDAGSLFPAGGGTFSGSGTWIYGNAASPVNAWTHVALTYDGAMLRLYVNGAQVASQARTGSVQTNTLPLRIGGNVPYGEYFQGLIDEVRIYNRALTQAEIQTDMTTPVGP
jgi:chitodextrinase